MATGQAKAVGFVSAIWRYPVKSMQGEELNATELTQRGLLGDRGYALLDPESGKIASAKNPKKWPRLFEFRARYSAEPGEGLPPPPVQLTLPDGTRLSSTQADVNDVLSKAIGRAVVLKSAAHPAPVLEEYWPDVDWLANRGEVTDVLMPADTFFDGAVVHLLTTATFESLQKRYPAGRFETRRFRPNIVVAVPGGEVAFVENDWIGRVLHLGDRVALRIEGGCPRCVMTTLPQADLPHDTGILRTITEHNHGNAGVYCSVAHEGNLRKGDAVRLT